jgi:hypothetical protein
MDYLLMGKMRLPFIDSHLLYKMLPLRQFCFIINEKIIYTNYIEMREGITLPHQRLLTATEKVWRVVRK